MKADRVESTTTNTTTTYRAIDQMGLIYFPVVVDQPCLIWLQNSNNQLSWTYILPVPDMKVHS